jgi:hypothetical protein
MILPRAPRAQPLSSLQRTATLTATRFVVRRGGTAPVPAYVLANPSGYRSPTAIGGKPMPWAANWQGAGGVLTGRMGREFAKRSRIDCLVVVRRKTFSAR